METIRKPLLPPSASQLSADWRRNFVADSSIKVLSILRKANPDEVRREVLVRSPVTPMKASDFPGGSVAKLMTLAPDAAFSQIFRTATTIDLTGVSSFSFPLPTNFAAATFTGEGQPIAVRQGAFAGFTVGPVRALKLITAMSDELQNASGNIATTVMSHLLEVAIGRGTDAVLLSANAEVPDVSPAGLVWNVTPIAGTASMSADLSALIAKIAGAGVDTNSVTFVCSPPQAMSLSLLAGPHFTHRIIEASALAAGSVVAIATAGLVVAGEGVPVIDTSKQTTLHMADPASSVMANAPTQSTFQQDTIALRCIARITWAAAPGSVAVCTGSSW